jgi:hypothetical protein
MVGFGFKFNLVVGICDEMNFYRWSKEHNNCGPKNKCLWFRIDLIIMIGKSNIENNNCGLKCNLMVRDKFDLKDLWI